MPLHHLQHFLIQTEELEKTKDWFVDVLGMRVGDADASSDPVGTPCVAPPSLERTQASSKATRGSSATKARSRAASSL